MRYLLDTHTFIWAISDKEKLSLDTNQILNNTKNSIFVSAVTFWEISLKLSINKLKASGDLDTDLPKTCVKMGFQLLPLSAEEGATFYHLPITDHKDPFDRMLIWQAIQRDLIFITKDRSIDQYQSAGLKTYW